MSAPPTVPNSYLTTGSLSLSLSIPTRQALFATTNIPPQTTTIPFLATCHVPSSQLPSLHPILIRGTTLPKHPLHDQHPLVHRPSYTDPSRTLQHHSTSCPVLLFLDPVGAFVGGDLFAPHAANNLKDQHKSSAYEHEQINDDNVPSRFHDGR